MRFCFITTVLLATIGHFTIDTAQLPKSFERCHKSDPGFNECYRKNVESAIFQLKTGSSELALNPFEPLLIPGLTIGQGSGPVNVEQHFMDVKLHGLTGSKVISGSVDFDKHILYAHSITPNLRLEAQYEMHGRILLLPVVGNGPCNVTLINTKINHTLQAEPFQKKDKTFWKFTDYTVTLRPERVMFNFENMFDGDERLGTEINRVLNENWNEVFTDVRPGYEKSFGVIFHDLANRVFTRVPIKDIFLD